MSLLTYVVRFTDRTIWKRKIHKTKEFKLLQNIDLFHSEELFKKFLYDNFKVNEITTEEEHEHYDNRNALFAPYIYGIVFVDFVMKKIHSYNGYSGFMNDHVALLRSDLKNGLFRNQEFNQENLINSKFRLTTNINGKDVSKTIFILSEYNPFQSGYLYNLNKAINYKDKITYISCDNEITYIEEKNLYLALQKVFFLYDNYHKDADPIDFYLDELKICPAGFEVTSSDNSKEEIQKLYNLLKDDIRFTSIEKVLWRKYQE